MSATSWYTYEGDPGPDCAGITTPEAVTVLWGQGSETIPLGTAELADDTSFSLDVVVPSAAVAGASTISAVPGPPNCAACSVEVQVLPAATTSTTQTTVPPTPTAPPTPTTAQPVVVAPGFTG